MRHGGRSSRGGAHCGSMGKCVADYLLDGTLEHGHCGSVKQGVHLPTSEPVAVKVLKKDRMSVTDIQHTYREVRSLARAHHPNILTLLDVFESSSHVYIVTEMFWGTDIADLIRCTGKLSEQHARRVFGSAVAAIADCHARGIAHRDLKPESVLIDGAGAVKVVDFANAAEAELQESFAQPLSHSWLRYASPEKAAGRRYRGKPSDVWSLGVCLYLLLTGGLPFEDEDLLQLRERVTSGVYAEPDGLSPEARTLLAGMLAVDPDERSTLPEIASSAWLGNGKTPASQPIDGLSARAPEMQVCPPPLDQGALRELEAMGYNRNVCTLALERGKPNGTTATYLLLLKRRNRLSGEAADRSSEQVRDPSRNSASSRASLEERGASRSSSSEGRPRLSSVPEMEVERELSEQSLAFDRISLRNDEPRLQARSSASHSRSISCMGASRSSRRQLVAPYPMGVDHRQRTRHALQTSIAARPLFASA